MGNDSTIHFDAVAGETGLVDVTGWQGKIMIAQDCEELNGTKIMGRGYANFPVETLDLSRCKKLAALPKAIGGLAALTALDLSWCESLAALPEAIGRLAALTTLNLSGCSSLAALPASIGDLKALTTLNLHSCTSLAALRAAGAPGSGSHAESPVPEMKNLIAYTGLG